jgi:hypothetical protein
VRKLAKSDPDRCAEIMRWRLADALEAYVAMVIDEAHELHRFELLTWAIKTQGGGKSKPPKPPEILRHA